MLPISRYYVPKDYYAPTKYAIDVFCITLSLDTSIQATLQHVRSVPGLKLNPNKLKHHIIRYIERS